MTPIFKTITNKGDDLLAEGSEVLIGFVLDTIKNILREFNVCVTG